MMSDDKVIPLHSYNTIEIDDTRLQAMWRSHSRRQSLVYGVLALAGVAVILFAVAAVVWAAMSGGRPAPQVKVDVQPPNVTVNLPKQPAPVVNITVPERPLRPAEPQPSTRAEGAPPIVTEYAIFKEVQVGDLKVETGWEYKNSTDTVPHAQWCYTLIGATGRLELGANGQPSETLATDAQALNLPEAQAQALLKQCQWIRVDLDPGQLPAWGWQTRATMPATCNSSAMVRGERQCPGGASQAMRSDTVTTEQIVERRMARDAMAASRS
jgi:hypothetical protein